MTDETHGMDPIEEPVPSPDPVTPAEAHDEKSVLAGAGDFTSGEGLVAFAGMVILAVWVIFAILATEYFLGFHFLLLSTAAVILPRVDRATVERVHPLPVIMKVLGYAIAILGVFLLVEDIRFEAYDEIWAVLGALITYAGCVMAFIGARQIKI